MLNIFVVSYNFIMRMNLSDWILFITFLAILWYSWETRKLRKLQQKQVLLSVFYEQTKDWDGGMKVRTEYPLKFREIVETGKYDPKWAYSSGWHQPVIKEGVIKKYYKLLVGKFKKS